MKGTRWKHTLRALVIGAALTLAGTAESQGGVPVRPNTAIDPAGCVTAECHGEVTAYDALHGPVAARTCDACHAIVSEELHTFELWREGEKICTYCHQFDTGQLPVIHAPVVAGQCLGCHNPHGGVDKRFVREATMAATCGRCHESVSYGRDFLHDPIANGECTNCHRPHAARYPMLLDLVGEQLCLGCHEDFGEQMVQVKFTHGALDEGCAGCHDVHASEFPMGISQSLPDLCLGCHEDIRKSTEAAISHSSVMDQRACLSCHTAHGGDMASLMRDLPLRVCMDCHEEKTESGGTETLAAMIRMNDSTRFQHTPVREGQCGGCHTIHGGENSSLLTKSYETDFHTQFAIEKYDLCFECHDEQMVLDPQAVELTNFRDGEQNLHFLHVSEGGEFARNCRVCHGVHTSKYPALIRDKVPYGNWMMPIRFEQTMTGGTCMTGCHTQYHYDRNSGRTSIVELVDHSPRIPPADKNSPLVTRFTARDISGMDVQIPDQQEPYVLLFLRPDHPQSPEVVKAALESNADAQIVTVVCGSGAEEYAQELNDTYDQAWTLVADAEFALSKPLGINTWPAVLVLRSDGTQVAHIGGAPPSLAIEIQAYAEFASDQMDRETLQQRIAKRALVGDSPQKRATWNLWMGRKLLNEGEAEQARSLFAEGLKLSPDSTDLQIQMIRANLMLNLEKEAINLLDRLADDALPLWERRILRGRALAGMEQWDEARRLAIEVLKENPQLGEAHMLMGRIHEHDQQCELAAEAYRAALATGGR